MNVHGGSVRGEAIFIMTCHVKSSQIPSFPADYNERQTVISSHPTLKKKKDSPQFTSASYEMRSITLMKIHQSIHPSIHHYFPSTSTSLLLLLLRRWFRRDLRLLIRSTSRIPSDQIGKGVLTLCTILDPTSTSSILAFSLSTTITFRSGIPATTEAASERSQLAGLVDLDVLQGLLVRVPEHVVPRVLGALVQRERRRRSHRVRAAVGELDELRECVGASGALYQGRGAGGGA